METLDNPLGIPDPANVSPRPTATRYGLIGGLVLIAFGLVMHYAGISDPADPENSGNTIVTVVNYLALTIITVLAIKTHKEEELGGYITLGRSLGVGALTGLVIGIITAIWMFVFFNLIAPDMLEAISEMAMEQMEDQGLSEEQIEASAGMMSFFVSPTWFAIVSILGTVFFTFIVSLVAGAVLKKEPPMAA